ncbi:MAG: FecR domain-containing protein, partial [Spirochaetales bacterium]|nr:FecR domain-containing protein [Spirochaetales bacterium]
SILKLAMNTKFKIQALQTDPYSSNDFALLGGKLRTIAARSGTGENYSIQTQSAVCGVRGTDFITESIGRVIVKRGLVQVDNLVTGESISVATGQFADIAAAVFQAVQMTAEQIEEAYNDVQLISLDETTVPGAEEEPEADETPAEEEPEEVMEEEEIPPAAEVPALPEAPEEPEPEVAEAPAEPGPFDAVFDKLREILGMEIGTTTINGTTYSKAILQPTFAIGKLKMALYLPVIYEANMFDPEDWYHPEGNDEWSFGTDADWENDPWGGVSDIVSDLFLKIRYIQWGEQRDKFFFKVGNVNNMTVGHGLLMYNYANDADFPAIRRVGINLGLQGEKAGFEAVVNDVASPEIMGARVFFRPFHPFKLALGLSGIVDINPDRDLPGDFDYGTLGADPMFLNASFDLDIPLVETDFLSMVLFGDLGGMVPYAGGQFLTQVVYDETAVSPLEGLRNYGIAAGLFGNIFIVDYRLEYRNFKGIFRPAFFNTTYDRMRGSYVAELRDYLANPADPVYDNTTMGIYGQAGFEVKDLFRLEGGYVWTWEVLPDKTVAMNPDEDYLSLNFILEPDVIPVVGIHGSIGYTRTGLAGSVQDARADDNVKFQLFDEQTVFRGELIYPVAPTLDVALLLTTALSRDEAGNLEYDADGRTVPYTTITIDTRIHF